MGNCYYCKHYKEDTYYDEYTNEYIDYAICNKGHDSIAMSSPFRIDGCDEFEDSWEEPYKGFEAWVNSLTEDQIEAFINAGRRHPEHCVHKLVHIQETGESLSCKECPRTRCDFHGIPFS